MSERRRSKVLDALAMILGIVGLVAVVGGLVVLSMRSGGTTREFIDPLAERFQLDVVEGERSHWTSPVDVLASGEYRGRALRIERVAEVPQVWIPTRVPEDWTFYLGMGIGLGGAPKPGDPDFYRVTPKRGSQRPRPVNLGGAFGAGEGRVYMYSFAPERVQGIVPAALEGRILGLIGAPHGGQLRLEDGRLGYLFYGNMRRTARPAVEQVGQAVDLLHDLASALEERANRS